MKRNSRTISASDAAKNFGALMDRVRSERAEYTVERGGSPAVRVVPAAVHRCSTPEFVAFMRAHSRADEAYLKAVEAGIKKGNKPAVPEDRWER
jgi:prevent-host-death family protein